MHTIWKRRRTGQIQWKEFSLNNGYVYKLLCRRWQQIHEVRWKGTIHSRRTRAMIMIRLNIVSLFLLPFASLCLWRVSVCVCSMFHVTRKVSVRQLGQIFKVEKLTENFVEQNLHRKPKKINKKKEWNKTTRKKNQKEKLNNTQRTQWELKLWLLLLLLDTVSTERALSTEHWTMWKMNLRCDLADARNATNSVVVVSVDSSRSTLWYFFFYFSLSVLVCCRCGRCCCDCYCQLSRLCCGVRVRMRWMRARERDRWPIIAGHGREQREGQAKTGQE